MHRVASLAFQFAASLVFVLLAPAALADEISMSCLNTSADRKPGDPVQLALRFNDRSGVVSFAAQELGADLELEPGFVNAHGVQFKFKAPRGAFGSAILLRKAKPTEVSDLIVTVRGPRSFSFVAKCRGSLQTRAL